VLYKQQLLFLVNLDNTINMVMKQKKITPFETVHFGKMNPSKKKFSTALIEQIGFLLDVLHTTAFSTLHLFKLS